MNHALLPLDCLLQVAQHLEVEYYLILRATCSNMARAMPKVPKLSISAFKREVLLGTPKDRFQLHYLTSSRTSAIRHVGHNTDSGHVGHYTDSFLKPSFKSSFSLPSEILLFFVKQKCVRGIQCPLNHLTTFTYRIHSIIQS